MSELTVVFKGCPGYRLYVTGHSLGASLAQLFAMEAAASTDEFIPKPVTTINFASPKVGDIYFRNCFEVCHVQRITADFVTLRLTRSFIVIAIADTAAFQDLEDQGKLRCLRFCNDADIIPTLPGSSEKYRYMRQIRVLTLPACSSLLQIERTVAVFVICDASLPCIDTPGQNSYSTRGVNLRFYMRNVIKRPSSSLCKKLLSLAATAWGSRPWSLPCFGTRRTF